MEQERPRSRLTVDYNVTPLLTLGLEYNFLVEELGFRGSYVLQRETEKLPQVHFNTSSDRIGTPEGYQQYSLTFAKALPGTPISPYVSVTYSGFDDQLVFPFGVNLQLGEQWSLLGMNDGRKSHLLLNFNTEEYYVQVGWIWFERASITVGFGF